MLKPRRALSSPALSRRMMPHTESSSNSGWDLKPKPLLKKVPNPKSVYVKPPGLGVNPKESGVVSHNNAILGFLGKPRLAEPQHVNAGVVSAAALVSVPVVVDGVVPEPVPGVWVLPLPSRWHVLQPALPRNRL